MVPQQARTVCRQSCRVAVADKLQTNRNCDPAIATGAPNKYLDAAPLTPADVNLTLLIFSPNNEFESCSDLPNLSLT